MLKTDAERRCWPFLWWWPLATSVGCGPAVGLCYGHGRLNRLRRLGRSMAYHYFHIETGGVAKGGEVLRGAALHAPQQSQTLQRSSVVGPIDSVLSHRRMQSSRCYIVAGQQRDCHCRRRRGSDPHRQWKIEWAEGRARVCMFASPGQRGKMNMTEEKDGVATDR